MCGDPFEGGEGAALEVSGEWEVADDDAFSGVAGTFDIVSDGLEIVGGVGEFRGTGLAAEFKVGEEDVGYFHDDGEGFRREVHIAVPDHRDGIFEVCDDVDGIEQAARWFSAEKEEGFRAFFRGLVDFGGEILVIDEVAAVAAFHHGRVGTVLAAHVASGKIEGKGGDEFGFLGEVGEFFAQV